MLIKTFNENTLILHWDSKRRVIISLFNISIMDTLRFAFNKYSIIHPKILYLKVGKPKSLFDSLNESSDDKTEWLVEEVESFSKWKKNFSNSSVDAIVLNLDVDDDLVIEIRKSFWKDFIWQTEDKALPLAIVIPETTQIGSLSRSQIIESLSLNRIYDRGWNVFENKPSVSLEIMEWLYQFTHSFILQREKAKEEKEKLKTKE